MGDGMEKEQALDMQIGLSYIKTGSRTRKILDNFLHHFITVMFILMFLIIMLNILSRYLPIVIIWAEIAAKICNNWVTFVGSAILIQTGGHIRVNYFDAPLKNKGLFNLYALFISILTLIVCSVIMYGAYLELRKIWPEFIPSWPAMRQYWIWLPALVGMGFAVIYTFLNLIAIVKTILRNRKHPVRMQTLDKEA